MLRDREGEGNNIAVCRSLHHTAAAAGIIWILSRLFTGKQECTSQLGVSTGRSSSKQTHTWICALGFASSGCFCAKQNAIETSPHEPTAVSPDSYHQMNECYVSSP